MLIAEGFSTQLSLESAPEIVNTALPGASEEKRLELGRVASLRFDRQCVLGRLELLLEQVGPVIVRERRRIFAANFNRLAEVDEDFRQAFLPEHELRGHGQKDGALHPLGEMAETGLESHRPLAHIGEAALRRDGEQVPGRPARETRSEWKWRRM